MTDVKTGAMQEFEPAAAQAGPTAAGLALLYADDFVRLPAAWPFGPSSCRIGRDASANLCLEVNAVSREHARIDCEGGVFVIRDSGSTNGTLVDGVRIEGPTPLEPMAEIRIGDAIVKFVSDAVSDFAKYRIDGALVGGARRRSAPGSAVVGGYQMDLVAARIERIAPTELSVMLFGESGTGKEVVARELHRLSGRRGKFGAVNCAAIPANLLESELFGYKRGAFTGAERDKPGLIRAAHEGTLLLDEIGDMPLEAQAKLLRVLQSKELWPVGATSGERVDVRVVSATHRDLRGLLRQERFRSDLFARLNEDEIALPPLRERKEDIYLLLRTFLARHGRPALVPSLAFMIAILHHDWPFNVRELEACAKRAVALADGLVLSADLLPDSVKESMVEYNQRSRGPGLGLPASQGLLEPPGPRPTVPTAEELRALLNFYQGNVAAVGRQLGKARMQIHRWMKRYGIEVGDYR
jgi:sigma-54 dependent transcriptional regulator, acetoin dehydrogenase operon transcriptional activator AcoR